MVYEYGREIKGRLSGLSFKSIDNDWIVFTEKAFDLIDGAGS